MLFVSVDHFPSLFDIPDNINGIEIRLDLLTSFDLQSIDLFIKKCPKPVMLTLRSKKHGGKFEEKEEVKEKIIQSLVSLNPAFLDLEIDMRKEFLEKVIEENPQIHCVLSHHFLEENVSEKLFYKTYDLMSQYKAFGYKIATLVSSTTEALKILLFSRSKPKLSIICMGECGSFSRVLGPYIDNQIDYACLNEKSKTALGQLSATEMINIYRYHKIDKNTFLYGVIGDPIEKSQGHIYHNNVFEQKNINAVYVKMIVKPDEVFSFLALAKEIGFKGLSVTMPLKEIVYPFTITDPCSKEIKAVNTLLLDESGIFSTNTDGKGALNAIEEKVSVRDKNLLIIGAGGSARAIAFEAKKRGAKISIINRTLQKAIDLANEVGGKGSSLNDASLSYDVLINCSPDPSHVDLSTLNNEKFVMDIVYNPENTPFLQRAAEKKAQIIYGKEMFFKQADAQTNFWSL